MFQDLTEPNLVLPLDQNDFFVILLGTGTPRAYPNAAKPALVVVAGGRPLLFDCGSDTVRQLIACGVMSQRIGDVFFTHHHYDHNAGFPDLFISSWRTHVGVMAGRSEPLRVYGPSNTRQIIGKFHDALSYDIGLRLSYNKSDEGGAEVVYRESDEGVLLDEGGVRVTAFAVDHRPASPAVGYSVEFAGRKVVISGDTRPVETTLIASRGASLLIHDAYNAAWLAEVRDANPDLAVQVMNPAKYHTTTLEAATLAASAGVPHLVLTHHIPVPRATPEAEASYTSGMAELYSGRITLGRDLMRLDVP
ncbi:MBL fold metallo-hydrolase (plasmid) [Deinococcus sp. KNUC1210]|uniref:MBL fold metallo-hydrolase n=1 Tax=Deinococcus sp. KNUC1210 TaxID=2917691 RepID=UPI001EF0D859|nr:MBL fold metallo-hydrolase [Deinococcus sp. KNUC1210]ULH17571.1 MBL fold metallo-hydrolase [Deinococcus sp. KNUC1210]